MGLRRRAALANMPGEAARRSRRETRRRRRLRQLARTRTMGVRAVRTFSGFRAPSGTRTTFGSARSTARRTTVRSARTACAGGAWSRSARASAGWRSARASGTWSTWAAAAAGGGWPGRSASSTRTASRTASGASSETTAPAPAAESTWRICRRPSLRSTTAGTRPASSACSATSCWTAGSTRGRWRARRSPSAGTATLMHSFPSARPATSQSPLMGSTPAGARGIATTSAAPCAAHPSRMASSTRATGSRFAWTTTWSGSARSVQDAASTLMETCSMRSASSGTQPVSRAPCATNPSRMQSSWTSRASPTANGTTWRSFASGADASAASLSWVTTSTSMARSTSLATPSAPSAAHRTSKMDACFSMSPAAFSALRITPICSAISAWAVGTRSRMRSTSTLSTEPGTPSASAA
mmetsp:Transcript_15689/g.49997  ORF Transcript_15689/g.49997 Transcript_15689/m.49997 type:complete len:413 (+) Transcript_15689:43-1281(+)